MSHDEESTRLWGGRFSSAPDTTVLAMSSSAVRAWRLVPYDLLASRAHAEVLHSAGVLDDEECAALIDVLIELDRGTREGTFRPTANDEDIHTAVEAKLLEKLGATGGKLRAGRSRNDQAATDLRLYLRDSLRHVVDAITDLERALFEQAERNSDVIVPGMTHLQHAQPVPLAHQLLAHVWPLVRDVERIVDWDRRAAISPLGSAALAGSTIPVDPAMSAQVLGFQRPAANSMDAVADRDFVAEALFLLALLAVHLSRLAEELVLWATQEFSWVELDDRYATGSSIMPQKKNPDVAELARGKAGRLIGDLTGFLVTLKGLPLTYNRDLQEDKDAVFDALDTLEGVLPALTGLVRTMRFRPAEIDASQGFTLATDLAERLVMNDIAFREAHAIVGRLVAYCVREHLELGQVPEVELVGIAGKAAHLLRPVPSVDEAVEARATVGATNAVRVQEQAQELQLVIDRQIGWARQDAPFRLRESDR